MTTFAYRIEYIIYPMSNQRYMQRGVSASEVDVHNAIKKIDKGIGLIISSDYSLFTYG